MQKFRKKDCVMKKFIIPAVVGAISALAVVLFLVKKKAPVEIEE